MNIIYIKFLKIILSDELLYKEFLNDLFNDLYNKVPNIKIDNLEIIINSYCKFILLIGFFENINNEKFKIRLLNNKVIEYEILEFKKNYSKYIQEVNKIKEDLFIC